VIVAPWILPNYITKPINFQAAIMNGMIADHTQKAAPGHAAF
jgi:hypothetical protein